MKNVKHLLLGLILILVSSVSFAGPPESIPKIEMLKETVKPVLLITPVVNEIAITCKAVAFEVVIVTEITRQKNVFVFANAPCLTSTFVIKRFPALCDPVNRHSYDIRQPNTELKTHETEHDKPPVTSYTAYQRKHYLYWQGNI